MLPADKRPGADMGAPHLLARPAFPGFGQKLPTREGLGRSDNVGNQDRTSVLHDHLQDITRTSAEFGVGVPLATRDKLDLWVSCAVLRAYFRSAVWVISTRRERLESVMGGLGQTRGRCAKFGVISAKLGRRWASNKLAMSQPGRFLVIAISLPPISRTPFGSLHPTPRRTIGHVPQR